MKIIDKRSAFVLIHSPGASTFPVYAVPPDAIGNDAGSIGLDTTKCHSIAHGDSDTFAFPDAYRLAVPSGRGSVSMENLEGGVIAPKTIMSTDSALPYFIYPPLTAGGWYLCIIQDD